MTIPKSVTSIGTWAFAGIYRFSGLDDRPVFIVEAGSYAEEYCAANDCIYRYPGEAD